MSTKRALTPKEKETKASSVFISIIKDWDKMLQELEHHVLYAFNGYTSDGTMQIFKTTFKKMEDESWKYYEIEHNAIERERKTELNDLEYLQKKYEQLYMIFDFGSEHLWIPKAKLFRNDIGSLSIRSFIQIDSELYIEENRDDVHFNWTNFNTKIQNKASQQVDFPEQLVLIPYIIGMARICSFLKKTLFSSEYVMQQNKNRGSKSENSYRLISKGKTKYLKDVHDSLINDAFIDEQTDLINFKAIFSGNLIDKDYRIKWIGTVPSLLYFIQVLHDREKSICKYNLAYLQTGVNCFVLKRQKGIIELEPSKLNKPGKLNKDDKIRINRALKPLIKEDSISVK